MKEYILKAYEYIFEEQPEEIAMELLLEEFTEDQVRKALRYLTYNKKAGTLRPPTNRPNPYGLIEAVIKTDKKRDGR